MLYNTSTSLSRSEDHNRQFTLYYQQYCYLHDHQPALNNFCLTFQELELQNNTQSLKESLSGVVHHQCSCNFTSVNLEDSQLTCSADGTSAVFTTTVAYSSTSGDRTATDMINTLKFWAAINGADALVQIGGTTATVHQVCTPSCESSSNATNTINASNPGGLTAGVFIGGLIAGIIVLAITVTIVW